MPPELADIARLVLSGAILIAGCTISGMLLSLAYTLHRTSRMPFQPDDYRTGMVFDRKRNRIIPVRRLTDKALARRLTMPERRGKPCR